MSSHQERVVTNLQKGEYSTIIQDYQSFLARTVLGKIHSRRVQDFVSAILFLALTYTLVILEQSISIRSFGSYFLSFRWLIFGRGLFYIWVFIGLLAIRFFTDRFYKLLVDDLISCAEDDGVLLLEEWLSIFSNKWIVVLSSFGASIFFALIRPYGFDFFVFASNFIGWIVITYTFLFFLFPIFLSRIHLNLNRYDPANSTVVKSLLKLANQLTLSMMILYSVGLVIVINRGFRFYIGFELIYFYTLVPVLALISSFHYLLSKKIAHVKFGILDPLDEYISDRINPNAPVDLENINQLIAYRNNLANTQDSTLDLSNIVRLFEIVIIPLILQLIGIVMS